MTRPYMGFGSGLRPRLMDDLDRKGGVTLLFHRNRARCAQLTPEGVAYARALLRYGGRAGECGINPEVMLCDAALRRRGRARWRVGTRVPKGCHVTLTCVAWSCPLASGELNPERVSCDLDLRRHGRARWRVRNKPRRVWCDPALRRHGRAGWRLGNGIPKGCHVTLTCVGTVVRAGAWGIQSRKGVI